MNLLKKFFFVNHKFFFLIIISLTLHLIAAYFSEGYYEQDEHFSILEPIIYKLGKNATLGWDFFYNYDKQWFLSFIFFYLIKFFIFCNIHSPFEWLFIIRIFTSLLGWISIICLIHIANKKITDQKFFNIFFYVVTLFWFYPYLHARPAPENISISFFIIAVTLFIYFFKNKKLIFVCGLLLGLSFVIRYTNLFIIGSFGLWILFFYKYKLFDLFIMFIGFLFIVFLSLLIDYWGYEEFTLVLRNYFMLNYEWQKSHYFQSNTKEWWYSFYLIFKEFLPPLSIIIIISMIIYWIRFPKNIITWITLPYFIFLCTLSHKETRFLFPILVFSPLFIIASFENLIVRGVNIFNKFFYYTFNRFFIKIIIGINILALIVLTIIPANNSTLLYKFLYKNEYEFDKVYIFDANPYKKSELLINFYRNENLSFTKILDYDECKKIQEYNYIRVKNKLNNDSKILTEYEEYKIEETQKYSYPNWIFEYHIKCNKESFFKYFPLEYVNNYFIVRNNQYVDYFENTQKSKCKMIYSTFPSWLYKINFYNWLASITTWHVYKCNT
jgi:phosphatidylinositol glycan class B